MTKNQAVLMKFLKDNMASQPPRDQPHTQEVEGFGSSSRGKNGEAEPSLCQKSRGKWKVTLHTPKTPETKRPTRRSLPVGDEANDGDDDDDDDEQTPPHTREERARREATLRMEYLSNAQLRHSEDLERRGDIPPKRPMKDNKGEEEPFMAFTQGELDRRPWEMFEAHTREKDMKQTLPRQTPSCQHPFTKDIFLTSLPVGFTLPNFNLYDGSIDPHDHLSHFGSIMVVYGSSDTTFCRTFLASLKGAASAWFSKLKPRSIGYFADLTEAFVTRFQSSTRPSKTAVGLRNLEERDYQRFPLSRFNQATLEIRDLSDDAQYNALTGALIDRDLVSSLTLSPPQSLRELISRCHQYAEVHDTWTKRKKAQ